MGNFPFQGLELILLHITTVSQCCPVYVLLFICESSLLDNQVRPHLHLELAFDNKKNIIRWITLL